MTRPLHLAEIRDVIAAAQSLLIAADFDGTICSAADRPECVRTPPRTASALQRLSALEHVSLTVLSGRAAVDIQARLPIDAIFAGNHGLEIVGKQFNFVHPEAERLASQLGQICVAVEQAISSWPGAWVENKRLSATVHVRNCHIDDTLAVRDAIRSIVRPVDDVFTLRSSRAAFDIAPRIGWDKGSALKYIARELAREDVLTLCIGDDETDEAMFGAVNEGITIRACPSGHSDTMYSLPDPSAVTELLEWTAGILESVSHRSTLYRLPRGGLYREVPV